MTSKGMAKPMNPNSRTGKQHESWGRGLNSLWRANTHPIIWIKYGKTKA